MPVPVGAVMYALILLFLLTYTIHTSLHAPSLKRSLSGWYLSGFVINVLIYSPFYTILPFEGIALSTGIIVVTLIVTFLSTLLGLLYLIPGYAIWIMRGSLYQRFGVTVIALVAVEMVRPYVFTLITWGGGSVLSTQMSTGAIGSILALTPFIAFARIGGVFALNFVLIYAVSLLVYPLPKRIQILGLIFLLLSYGMVRYGGDTGETREPVRFAIVQTAFPHVPEGEDIDQTHAKRVHADIHPLVLSLVPDHPALIVLPEDLRYLDLQTQSERAALLARFPDTLIVDGATRMTGTGRKNVSIIYDTQTNQSSVRAKWLLFPFGEYVPYFVQVPLRVLLGEARLSEYQYTREYTVGEFPRATETRLGRIGVLICSELWSHDAMMRLKASDPDIVIVQSSMTWTDNSAYYATANLFALKILAVTLEKPVISVTNTGESVMVDKWGRVTAREASAFATHLYTLNNDTIEKIR